MLMNIMCQCFRGYIILVDTEGVFNFFGDQLKTGQHIKDKSNYRHYIKTQLEHIAKRQCHDVKENEFFYKDAVRKRDWGVLNPFTGTADVGKGLQFGIKEQ